MVNFPSSKIYSNKNTYPSDALGSKHGLVPEILEWNGRSNAANPLVVSEESGWPSERKGGQNTKLVSIMEQPYAAMHIKQWHSFFAHEKIKIHKSMTNMALRNAVAVNTLVNEIYHLNVLWLCKIMTVL